MLTRLLQYQSCKIAQLVCIGIIAIITWNALADNSNGDVYIRAEIAQDSADVYTVTLFQNTTESPAATLVLFLLLDSDNATLLPCVAPEDTSNEYAQLAAAQQEAGFMVADTWHTTVDNTTGKTCLVIAIYNANGTGGLRPGALLSFKMQLAQEDGEQIQVRIESVTKQAPLYLDNTPFFSSAATVDARELAVAFEPQAIISNCEQPAPPERIHASWRYRKKIIVTWQPPDTSNPLEYRVYRSTTDTLEEAIPINESWTSDLAWTDSLDEDALDTPPAGCSCTNLRYYYWIRSRDLATGCVSDFSDPATQGSTLNW